MVLGRKRRGPTALWPARASAASAALRMSKVSRTLTICVFYPHASIPQLCSSFLLLGDLALRAVQPINFLPEFIFANLPRGPPMLL
jgi:hypothetical protein